MKVQGSIMLTICPSNKDDSSAKIIFWFSIPLHRDTVKRNKTIDHVDFNATLGVVVSFDYFWEKFNNGSIRRFKINQIGFKGNP